MILSDSASERSRPPPSDAGDSGDGAERLRTLAREEAHHPGQRAELGSLRRPAHDLAGARQRLGAGDRRGERPRDLAGALAHRFDLLCDRRAILHG